MLFSERIMWYKIIQNLNNLRCLVIDISAFEFDAYHGCRAGTGKVLRDV